MNNAEKFEKCFGIYATELWAMPEQDFLKWLSDKAREKQWIPCDERLPKVGEEVLCQCRANIIEVLCLGERGFWENPSSFRHYFNSFVIAWMPLPEPYDGERGK